MEPMPNPVTPQHPADPSTARFLQLPLALFAIFVLECLIALHTLWPNYPPYALPSLWIAVAPWIRWGPSKTQAPGWTVPLVLGIVVAAEAKARPLDLRDLPDIAVSWKEPWAGAAEKSRE